MAELSISYSNHFLIFVIVEDFFFDKVAVVKSFLYKTFLELKWSKKWL